MARVTWKFSASTAWSRTKPLCWPLVSSAISGGRNEKKMPPTWASVAQVVSSGPVRHGSGPPAWPGGDAGVHEGGGMEGYVGRKPGAPSYGGVGGTSGPRAHG